MADHPSDEPKWLMPSTVEVEPPGAMRFLVQPRWASGNYVLDGGLRRRDMPTFTELEVELPFAEGSMIGVINLVPQNAGSSVMVATCFDSFFQPLRYLLYGPGDEFRQRRLWERLPTIRPLFMAANYNGLTLKREDIALIREADPSDGTKKSLLVSVDHGRSFGSELDEAIMSRCARVLDIGLQLFDEALVPLDFDSIYQGIEMAEMLAVAGSAAKWLFKHAGDIGDALDVIDLIDQLTD